MKTQTFLLNDCERNTNSLVKAHQGGEWRTPVLVLLALLISAGIPAHADIRVVNRALVSSAVVNPTATDYTYLVQVKNHGDAATQVTAKVTSFDPGATVISGNLNFPDIRAGKTATSLNTYTIRRDPKVSVNDNLIRLAFLAVSRPVANAGPDQFINVLNSYWSLDGDRSASPHCCLLNARGSYDPFGRMLTYSWKVISRPQGSATTDPSPGVVTHFVPDVPGDYVLQLTVNNGVLSSDPSTIKLSTVAVPPMADAGRDQTARQGQLVQLDGTQSVNAMGRPITYSWTFVSSPKPPLSDPQSPRPTFRVEAPGTYRVQLQVTDGLLTSKPSIVTINTANTPPHADAGPDTKAAWRVGTSHGLLFANRSTDSDGDFLTYRWFLLNQTPSCPSLVPVCQPSELATSDPNPPWSTLRSQHLRSAHIQLMVSDGYSESISTVIMGDYQLDPADLPRNFESVLPAIPAVKSASSLPASYTLDASPSATMIYDSTLGASWSLLYRPLGSRTAVSGSPMTTTLTPDVNGIYVAQLQVRDWGYQGAPKAIAVSTLGGPPVAVPGRTQWLEWTRPVAISVNGSASWDPDRHPLTYRWSLLSKPLGSAAVLSSSNVVAPTFTADVNGTYILQLIVNDGLTDSLPATVSVITKVNSKPLTIGFNFHHPWKESNCIPTVHFGGDKETEPGLVTIEVLRLPRNGFLSGQPGPYMLGGVTQEFIATHPPGYMWGSKPFCYVPFVDTFTGTDSWQHRVVDNGFPAGCNPAASDFCQPPEASDVVLNFMTIFEI